MVGCRFFRFTVVSFLCILLISIPDFLKDRHSAVRLLAPFMHCLGCFMGIVFGLHFNQLGINAVSGCLLGIVSAALIVQSISKLHLKDFAPLAMVLVLLCLVILMLYFYIIILFLHFGPLIVKYKWISLFNLVPMFGQVIGGIVSGNTFLVFQHMGNLINQFYSTIAFYTNRRRFCVYCTLLTYIITFIDVLQYAIANKNYSLAFYVGSALASCISFAAVGWYYSGFLGMPSYVLMGFNFSTVFVVDEEVARSWQHGTRGMVLYVTCRLLGVGICGLTIRPLLWPFLDLCKGWLFKRFFSFYIQSVCQFLAAEFGVQADRVYTVLKAHVVLFGFSSWYMVIVSGAVLGGLCGQAMVMLTNSSNDEKITGWSLMFFGSVLGTLTGYSTLGLKVGVPVGGLVGCSIAAATLLWKSGYNFKAFFQRNVPQNFVSKIRFIGWLGQKIMKWRLMI